MAALSVDGVGKGAADKRELNDLAALSNGPTVVFSGIAAATNSNTSPPVPTNTVYFPYALSGAATSYAVFLTSLNGGLVYVSNKHETSGHFDRFTFIAEAEGSVHYMVCTLGSRPNL